MDRLSNFLKELAELTIKYDLEITGCGCCGSPYLVDNKEEYDVEDLEFVYNKKGLEFKEGYYMVKGERGDWLT